MYLVKEIFYTLQGEGANAGRPAVFCRFTGCNLWSGLERDRQGAICNFCDTDFVGVDGDGGGKFKDAIELARAIRAKWPASRPSSEPFVVCTGGEPLLQIDAALITALHQVGFTIAVETNGTIQPPEGLDWICVSPKAKAPLVVRSGDEIKVVFPQEGLDPESFASLEFRHKYIQPLDGPDINRNMKAAVQYCLSNPRWRLSLQAHKVLEIR
jgi:7-carboxy-7-deazaguanine synthase